MAIGSKSRISFLLIYFFTIGLTWSQKGPEYLLKISSEQDFQLLKGRPNAAKFSEVDALKVVLDTKSGKIYYINSAYHDYHVTFCQEVLGYPNNGVQFNYDNYTVVSPRQFLMGTINRFKQAGLYTLEFSVADNISPNQISTLLQKIYTSFLLTKEIAVFLNTNRLRELKPSLTFPTVDASTLYEGQNLQLLNDGKSLGKIVFTDVHNGQQANYYDIVVINGTPDDLPPVAGVITTDFQTPLSHITLLCQNRGTPMLALKTAFSDSLLTKWRGKFVSMTVNESGYFFTESDSSTVMSYWENKLKNKKKIILEKKLQDIRLIPISELGLKDISRVGGKAANFALMRKTIKEKKLTVKFPEAACAIPMYYYDQHLKRCGADSLINELIARKKFGYDLKELQLKLDSIQKRIMKQAVDSSLIGQVQRWMQHHGYSSFRFRSSTNAEDLDGFNGAGLYTSKTGYLDHPKKTIEKAIKTVWASAWGFRPFMERDYFGIDQESVAMGVLCHRNFEAELANGVVITKNLYRPNYRGFVINAQYGETSVVIPPDSAVCEQVICYSDKNDSFYGKKSIVEYLTYSNILPKGVDKVLLDSEINRLTREISVLKKVYYDLKKPKETYYNYGLDLEFKVVGPSREIYIKQIRPFKD
jgi:pyruvate,water dikinase